MKALVLCGGLGSRPADASALPKPMVPIGGTPMVWHHEIDRRAAVDPAIPSDCDASAAR